MSAIENVVVVYATIAFVGAFVGAMMLATEDFAITEQLGPEGRAVLGIVLGLFWIVPVALGLGWVVIRAWRGVMQIVRLVRPTKPKVPRAEVRR